MEIIKNSGLESVIGRLVIIDDDAEMLKALCETLADRGYEISGFTKPYEALEVLKEEAFDIMLTDLKMPEMDGISVVQKAREIAPNLVVIIMTGQGAIDTAVKAMKLGALDYVLKPFKMNMLLPVLSRAMEVRRLQTENIQLRESLAIYELSMTAAFSLEQSAILDKVADATIKGLNADELSIMLASKDGKELSVAVVRGESRKQILGHRMPIDKGIAGWVATQREPVTLRGAISDQRFTPVFPRTDINSSICVPMLIGGRVIGVLNVNATRRHIFTPGEAKALNILVNIAGTALDNAELHQNVKQAEEKYRSIFENAVEGIFQTTPDGRFLSANPAMARMLGYDSPDDLITNITDISKQIYVEPDKRDEYLSRLKNKGSVADYQFQAYRKDGSLIWIREKANVVKSKDGKVLWLEGICEDITEKREAENALKESEEKYRLHFESVFDVICTIDKDFRIMDVSPSVERILGYKPEELVGNFIQDLDILTPLSLMQAFSNKNGILKGEEISVTLYEFIAKDGTRKFGEVSGKPLVKNNEIIGVISVARDVTEKKKAEKELYETKQMLENIAQGISDGVLLLAKDLTVLWANEGSVKIAGKKIDDILHRKCFEAIFDLDDTFPNSKNPCPIDEILQTGQPARTTATLKTDKNENRFLEVSVYPVRDKAGQIMQFVHLCKDVTEFKKLELQYHQAQKMESIGRLAGGVAHDFNNLLTAILGYSSISLSGMEEDHPLKGNIEEIKKAAEQATLLTRQLLAFSRKETIRPMILDLNDSVRDMDKMVNRIIGEDIDLISIFDPDLCKVKMDPGQIEQVIMNLVVNAKDAMPSGGKLTIETGNVYLDEEYGRGHGVEIEKGNYAMVSLSDTGGGIDKELQANIFEPFFTTKEKGKGTGLGLATVYGIVKQNNGYVWVYSEKGEGTTFKIFLPQISEEQETIEKHRFSTKQLEGTETILLVEDDEDVLKVAKDSLDRYGYNVLEATGVHEALRISKEYDDTIQLMLTDVVMPVMSGRDLADKMASLRPEMKIIYMSGYTDNAIVHHGILDNGATLIQKPFSPQSLALRVRQILDTDKSE